MLHTWSDGKGGQKIEERRPLTRARMPTADQDLPRRPPSSTGHRAGALLRLVQRACVWTHLKQAEGVTGIGLYRRHGGARQDGRRVLKKLDDMGIADNTIVIYGTDNGAETVTWPDGGTTPYHSEKGTLEGGFLRRALAGGDLPGTIINDIMSQEDWMPTLLAAAGEPNIVAKLKQGYQANGKTFKIHPDGYNCRTSRVRSAKARARKSVTSARAAS